MGQRRELNEGKMFDGIVWALVILLLGAAAVLLVMAVVALGKLMF
jgi:hypothetical protein